jgi:hypothetical protein
MRTFQCPECGCDMNETVKDHWFCPSHGRFNVSYLIGIVHTKHKGPFHITLTTEQMDRLVDASHFGVVDEILNMAIEQGYLTPKTREDYAV